MYMQNCFGILAIGFYDNIQYYNGKVEVWLSAMEDILRMITFLFPLNLNGKETLNVISHQWDDFLRTSLCILHTHTHTHTGKILNLGTLHLTWT